MNKQIWILRGLSGSYYATQAVLLPYLPLYFMQKGYTPSQIGLLMTIGPFVAMFAQPMWGYISDRFHTVKKIILLLWSLTILSSIGLFYAESYPVSFLFMLLLYFFMMPSSPLMDSIVISSTLRAGVSYGSVRLWGSVGFTVVAVLSGFVLGWIGGVSHLQYMYWALWVIHLAILIFLRDEPHSGQRITFKTLGSIAVNGPFLLFLLMMFLVTIPHRMHDSLFVLYLTDLGGTEAMGGWAWALAAISEVPVFALLGRYMHRFHELALLGVVSVLYMGRWLLYALIDDPWLLVVLQVLQGITFAVFWTVAVQYAVRLVPPELRSTGQSLLSAVFLGLAGITGGYAGGWVKEAWGGAEMYYFGAALALIAGMMFFAVRFYTRRQENAPLK